MTREVLEHGMPRGAEMLNVNFPWKTSWDTRIKITSLEGRKWRDSVLERDDPRGRPYYWLWGSRMPHFKKNSDAYAIHKEGVISVSPLNLDFTAKSTPEIRKFETRVTSRLKEMAETVDSRHKGSTASNVRRDAVSRHRL